MTSRAVKLAVVGCAACLLGTACAKETFAHPTVIRSGQTYRSALAVNRIERPLAPAAISGIGGFVGTRLKANVDGYLKVFDIDHYVRFVEQKQYRDWMWIGEQPGKWLETAALAAEQTGDDTLRQKAEKFLPASLPRKSRAAISALPILSYARRNFRFVEWMRTSSTL